MSQGSKRNYRRIGNRNIYNGIYTIQPPRHVCLLKLAFAFALLSKTKHNIFAIIAKSSKVSMPNL